MNSTGSGNKKLQRLFKGADLTPKSNFQFLKEGLKIEPRGFGNKLKPTQKLKENKHQYEQTLFFKMFSDGNFSFYLTRLKTSTEKTNFPYIIVALHIRALRFLALGKRMQARDLKLLYNSGLRDFSGVNLFGSDFYNANLSGASLLETDLFWANFYKANLFEVNLAHAYLSGANLAKAKLCRANLEKANLSEANLYKANLAYANLNKANLTNANIFATDFTGTSLEAKSTIKS